MCCVCMRVGADTHTHTHTHTHKQDTVRERHRERERVCGCGFGRVCAGLNYIAALFTYSSNRCWRFFTCTADHGKVNDNQHVVGKDMCVEFFVRQFLKYKQKASIHGMKLCVPLYIRVSVECIQHRKKVTELNLLQQTHVIGADDDST
jgi:hypothetical protein